MSLSAMNVFLWFPICLLFPKQRMIQMKTFQDAAMLVSSVNTQHISVNRGELFASKCSQRRKSIQREYKDQKQVGTLDFQTM
jgi:hypothetical protein